MKRTGFTLVELLVVVSIIALLAAILLPSLGDARLMAQGAACLSNMKNAGTSLVMYYSDNHGYYPERVQLRGRQRSARAAISTGRPRFIRPTTPRGHAGKYPRTPSSSSARRTLRAAGPRRTSPPPASPTPRPARPPGRDLGRQAGRPAQLRGQ